MRSQRERSRAREHRRPWAAAVAAAVVAGTVLTAFSCATQESHDFSNGACVAGGCEETVAASAGSSTSSSSSSGTMCMDAGCPSWATDIYTAILDNGLTRCTDAQCHGPEAGVGAGGITLLPGDPTDAWTVITSPTQKTPPIPNAAGAKVLVVPCNPEASGLLCNMAVPMGTTNMYGMCGNEMPLDLLTPAPVDLTSSQIATIAAWIQCGAPNN
jgi:hypothetical protein